MTEQFYSRYLLNKILSSLSSCASFLSCLWHFSFCPICAFSNDIPFTCPTVTLFALWLLPACHTLFDFPQPCASSVSPFLRGIDVRKVKQKEKANGKNV